MSQEHSTGTDHPYEFRDELLGLLDVCDDPIADSQVDARVVQRPGLVGIDDPELIDQRVLRGPGDSRLLLDYLASGGGQTSTASRWRPPPLAAEDAAKNV
jgi:hypothetical protein